MRNCKNCGFPRKFAHFFRWRSDGSIVSTDRTGIQSQIVFLPAGELESLFERLSEVIGTSIDRFMIDAQKRIGKEILSNLPLRHIRRVPNNRILRPQWFAKLIIGLTRKDIAGLGDGRLTLESYRAGESLVLRFSNPCLIPMMVGSSIGMYESIEKMPTARARYGIEEGDLVIRLSHSEEKPKSEERLYLEKVEPATGQFTHDRCPDCGAPLTAAGTFEWNIKQGVITNRLDREREVIVSVQSVNAIFRELENEIGEDIPNILFDAQKEIAKRRLETASIYDLDSFWDGFLSELALRGLGYPIRLEREKGAMLVEVGLTYNQDLYAAKLAAGFEVTSSLASKIEWKRRARDRAAYRISGLAKLSG